jgi:hypothetical protein
MSVPQPFIPGLELSRILTKRPCDRSSTDVLSYPTWIPRLRELYGEKTG